MMISPRATFIVVAALLLFAGCAHRTTEISYYSLTDMKSTDLTTHHLKRSDIAIAVGPLTIPDYLKRAQIATRIGDGQYRFSEFHRWSGLLEENISTVVGNNLGLLLGTENVASYPWLEHFKPDYRVTIDFQNLDADLQGEAQLHARWAITDSTGQTLMASGKSHLKVPLEAASYPALSSAESRLLADFSRELSKEIVQLME